MESENKNCEPDDKKINILDLFKDINSTETSSGAWKCECPDCGLQGGRTEGFILFPDTNTAFCHTSGKWFRMLEAYALKKKIIRCLDGRETGDTNSKILGGELFTLTLEEFKNEFGTDMYNKLANELHIRKRVEIPGNNRTVSDFADEIGDIYKSRNILFKRAETGDIIRIDRKNIIKEDGEITIEGGLKKLEPEVFVSYAEMLIVPWTTNFTKNGDQMVVIKSMNQNHANMTLNSDNFRNKAPTLHRVLDIQIPMMYKKCLTFPKKGYDKRFGTWLPYNAPQIKKDMYTLEQAKELIEYIFREFCFETERDRLHAIAAFITPFCRGLFEDFSTRTPVFVYMANRERAGKDFCANCTGILYEGVAIEMPPISNGEQRDGMSEEVRKKITACMMEGKKRFHSSNNKGLLNNSAFESATTSKTWLDRVLGKSKTVTYNNEMDYSLSGNIGMNLTPDMSNRSRIIKLHLVDEDANARIFENPKLHQWIYERRVLIISAMYKLVENWIKQGMKPGSVPFTSFPEWARVVGGILEAAGYGSVCRKGDDELIALDNDTEEMKLLFKACYDKYPNQWIDKSQMQIEAESIMTFLDFNKRSDQTSFAIKIDKFVNRKLADILLKIDSKEKQGRYRKYMYFKELKSSNLLSNKENNSSNLLSNKENSSNLLSNKENNSSNLLSNKENTATPATSTTQVASLYIHLNKYCEYNDETDVVNVAVVAAEKNISVQPTIVQDKTLKPTIVNKNIQIFDEIGKEYLKKEAVENSQKFNQKIHEKTSRELQYFEDPQCSNIVEKCTEEQTLEWVKSNPGISYEVMDSKLGLGCFKHVGSLIDKGLIKPSGNGWEIEK